jgi:hypothetical protein
MRHAIGLFALPLLALGCTQSANAEDKKVPPPDPTALSEKATLLAPIQVDSLTLTPIVATPAGLPKTESEVLVLDQAFASKLVKIKENENESVNNLTLTNKGNKPLFLLAGEVIIGGKQDRIIGANTIIAANTTQSVPVFCVEHGRWTEEAGSREFVTGKALAHGRLRGSASFESQQAVWNEVSAKNAVRKTGNSTDTYRQVAQQQSNGTLKDSEKKVDAAIAKIAVNDRARMIGYVVALNGKVATVDMFESPTLFRKLENKLVRSYLTEAIDIVANKDAKPPSAKEVKDFMFDADKATSEDAYQSSTASTIRFKGAKLSNKAQVDMKPSKADPSAAPKPVYKNYQAK